ncbi:hypothetical protein R1sor_001991 [Riccia sorocarpa]|uniref:SNRNP25 ubiquitin-like domain-containing protein n=1 Tax=Riccia sorocarpa TaxID=122646 RepID=A0ABD3H072_9MARC
MPDVVLSVTVPPTLPLDEQLNTGRRNKRREEDADPSDGKGTSSYYQRTSQFEPLLKALLEDPVLSDVPKKPTLFDIETLLGVEQGSAMKLTILKIDNTTFDVAVLNTATVRDLKAAVQKKVDSVEESQLGHRHISWYTLGLFVVEVFMRFSIVPVPNSEWKAILVLMKTNDQIRFTQHVLSREAGRHSRAKKRRFFHGLRKNVNTEKY